MHLNVGNMWKTKKPTSKEFFYSGKEIAEFCNYFQLTHAVCIYSGYENLKELIDNAPNTKIYGVQWVVDLDNEVLDVGKEGWCGVKLHSHRGHRPIMNDLSLYGKSYNDAQFGVVTYGMDYGHKTVQKFLTTLPDNSLVYMHVQGAKTLVHSSSPRAVFRLSQLFPNLKFIMGHAGDYGAGTYKPSIASINCTQDQSKWSDEYSTFNMAITTHAASVTNIMAAVQYANLTHNIFLDTSRFVKHKAKILENSNKWAIGSDYPFGNNGRGEQDENFKLEDLEKMKNAYWNIDNECRQFAKIVGEKKVEEAHKAAVIYMESDVRELAGMYEWYYRNKEYLFL